MKLIVSHEVVRCIPNIRDQYSTKSEPSSIALHAVLLGLEHALDFRRNLRRYIFSWLVIHWMGKEDIETATWVSCLCNQECTSNKFSFPAGTSTSWAAYEPK